MALTLEDFIKIRDAVVGKVKATGLFDNVIEYEPGSAPTEHGLVAAFMGMDMVPIQSSGLAAVSIRLEIAIRIHLRARQEPQALQDAAVFSAAAAVMEAMAGDFDLSLSSPSIRCVDLFGSDGEPMRMASGWLQIDQTQYRMAEVAIPILINDVFQEA